MNILLKVPFFHRIIPSILRRYYKFFKLNQSYWEVRNIKMFLNFDDPLDRKIILFQKYEPSQFNFLNAEIKKNNPSYFFDIGANSGFYSFFIAQNFKKIRIFSFEPNRKAYSKFEKTLKKNTQFKNRIKLFKFGLLNKSGLFQMSAMIKNNYVQPGGSTIANKITINNPKFQIFYSKFKVLDKIIKIKKKTIVIKIDIEGNENLIIKGMKNLIKNNKIILQIEIYKKNFLDINKQLRSLGFKKIRNFESDYFYKNFN